MVGAVGTGQNPYNPVGSANGPQDGTGPKAQKLQQETEQQIQQQQQQQVRQQQQQQQQQQQIAAMTGLGMQLDIQG